MDPSAYIICVLDSALTKLDDLGVPRRWVDLFSAEVFPSEDGVGDPEKVIVGYEGRVNSWGECRQIAELPREQLDLCCLIAVCRAYVPLFGSSTREEIALTRKFDELDIVCGNRPSVGRHFERYRNREIATRKRGYEGSLKAAVRKAVEAVGDNFDDVIDHLDPERYRVGEDAELGTQNQIAIHELDRENQKIWYEGRKKPASFKRIQNLISEIRKES